tara:strand:+ start:445 stop:669 length:225 start_codon:yes stop_codon:yes gene_type:complete
MDVEEYAEMKKMESYRYNKLAAIFTEALEHSWERLRLIKVFDRAHQEGVFEDEQIHKLLKMMVPMVALLDKEDE